MPSNRIDFALKSLIVVFLLALGYVIVRSIDEPNIEAGSTAPNFSVTSDAGSRFTPKDFGGKLLLLNFWASWCPPCVQEAPSLNQLSQSLRPSGLVVLGISADLNPDKYKGFLDRFHVAFPTLRDPSQEVSYRYGTYKIPESYLIDRDGRVVQKWVGPPEKGWTDPEVVSSIQRHL